MRAKLELIVLFVAYVLSNASYRGQNNDVCSPFDIGCRDYGLADYYPRYHFNGRYMGDERMRIPFSIALNAPILGNI
ncbi:hypothetical protein THOM_0305 [Trachipleistophora hominis]|uniref:Uncharacterized protein n=1 Tax=Trachipleistophora hominis TaxID=72359 RepID=L7JZ35_TRAHO|nr:hypothetical protein THOM_0305 [Trachipleistophora hominis]